LERQHVAPGKMTMECRKVHKLFDVPQYGFGRL
jgi:hypothetical protein